MASPRAKGALASGLALIALTATFLIQPWEGRRNDAYWDRLGQVVTICDGHTGPDVHMGLSLTDEQCDDITYTRLENDFRKPLQRCIRNFDDAPLSVQASALSLAWNVGTGAVCGSTAARRMRVKNWRGACEAMTWFNRAGGRVIRGLKLRREMGDAKRIGELELCLAGLE